VLDLINPEERAITIAALWADVLIPLKYDFAESTYSLLNGPLRTHELRLELKIYSESGHKQYILLKTKLDLQDKHYPLELPVQLEHAE